LLPDGTRQQMRGTLDYSGANSTGSRGIFEYIPLTDGIYEVNDRYRWNKVRHYYLRVIGCIMTEITPEEVKAWLLAIASVT
jgi:O-methyltransferase involved in polyketide biosynthesis